MGELSSCPSNVQVSHVVLNNHDANNPSMWEETHTTQGPHEYMYVPTSNNSSYAYSVLSPILYVCKYCLVSR